VVPESGFCSGYRIAASPAVVPCRRRRSPVDWHDSLALSFSCQVWVGIMVSGVEESQTGRGKENGGDVRAK